MAKEYLDKTGLQYFWGKIKAYFADRIIQSTTSGNWKYRIYASGNFEAWYKDAASTVTLSTALSGASGWYRNSSAYYITLPQDFRNAHPNPTLIHADIHAITGLAGMYTTVTNFSDDGIISYYVQYSGQLSNRSTTITAYVFGTV